jgi:heme-degrading monooxygenase HmoA
MIERHITFNVLPDKTAMFERYFAETYRSKMSVSPGFIRADLLREADSSTRYQMVLRWQDTASATGWRTSPVHEALQPEWTSMYSDNEITVYDVIG